MKKISIILILGLICMSSALRAQDEDKSEYRYWNFVFGLNHGLGSCMGSQDATYMIHSDKGDLYNDKGGCTYTPGVQLGFVYNYDFKKNKSGIQAGVEFVDYGFQNKYSSKTNDYTVKETYRAMGVQVPVLFKFNGVDIYRDMFYFYIGAKGVFNFNAMLSDKASWTEQKFGKALDAKNSIAAAGVFGFNYNIFSLSVNYMFKDIVDPNYTDTEGFTPYSGIKGHIFICTSLNVPMTRWLSIHNWTAEKIRRKMHNGKTM